jgi:xanthine dehydrogenase accessory factor
MFEEFLKKSAELTSQGATFAVATVVRCVPPTSAKPGDKAIVYADGKLWGWIGGGCAQPVVAKEALKALAEGKPRLVRISASPDAPEAGIVDYTMTCHSGGALDIYIEPVLPKPQLVILGRSPVAQMLARLAGTLGYAVSVVMTEAAGEGFGESQVFQARDYSLEHAKATTRTMIVVATQGEGDEEALEQAVRTDAGYVAFVASRIKAHKVFDYLMTHGVAPEKMRRVRAPAGLDIGARSPEEIALSILAEIIETRRKAERAAEDTRSGTSFAAVNQETRDPVCGMSVDPDKARHRSEYEGTAFYFCCTGCKQAFDREPSRYLATTDTQT